MGKLPGRSMGWICSLTFVVALVLISGVASMAAESWGTAHNGLQISLSASGANVLNVSLRNNSEQDTMLNLGFMLAPGVVTTRAGKDNFVPNKQYQYPEAITLVLVDTSGKSTELELVGPPGVAGTLEPFEVPLPSGATYSIQTPLSKYWDPKTFRRVEKGTVQLSAKFTSKVTGSDKNKRYWTGTILSNTVTVKL